MVHEVSEHDWKVFGCATSLAISIVWLTSYRIGLNISDDGQFFAVTNGVTLILPNPSPWAKGIDDPKLYYSVSSVPRDRIFTTTNRCPQDRGTPSLAFVRVANHADMNHGGTTFLVEDLRDLFAPLDSAMALSEGVSPRDPSKPAGWLVARELIRESGMQKTW
jgi:hypothetical protein